jgi:hypothetical protein
MIATTTDAAALLALLVRGKWAVRKVSSLARLLDAGPEAVAAALAELVGRGLVEIWSRPAGGPAAVLSPLAAAQLGVRLDASGRRWVPAGSRERAPRRYESGTYREADLARGDSAPFRLDDLAVPLLAYCCRCCRSGVDHLLPKARPMPDRKAPAKFRPKAAGARRAALRGGL